jgi:acid phosphatase type 7
MKRRDAVKHIMTAAAAPLVVGGCSWDRLLQPQFSASQAGPITLIGAGDQHAVLKPTSRGRTAALVKSVLDANPSARAFAVGDLAHQGTEIEYQQYYHNTWGAFKERTLFCMGNHDSQYTDPGGAAYNAYTRAPRYYVQTLGTWRCYVLNCSDASRGGASRDEQTAWLRADLAQHPNHHILAMFHYPMFASVCEHHLKPMTYPFKVGPWWQVLQDHGAEFVISGHAHRWERFRRKLRDGTVSTRGIRQFVIGSGGVRVRGVVSQHPDSEKVVVENGVARFDLYADHYEWTFTNQWGVVRDRGTQSCRKVLV